VTRTGIINNNLYILTRCYLLEMIRFAWMFPSIQPRRAMCVTPNTDVRSRNHSCRGKAISTTYFSMSARVRVHVCGCVITCLRACSLTYPACNAHPNCHLRPLWLPSTIFLDNISLTSEKRYCT
jgi:hypothetical protein